MKKIWLLIFFTLISGRIAQAGDLDHFLVYGPSAATLAMGEANIATAQDAGAIHYNPALLYSVDDQFMLSHYFPAEDKTKFDFFAFTSGDEDSALAFSGEQFKDTVNTQTMWRIGYAKRLRIFDIGATLKWLRYSTKVWKKSRFAADIGIAKQITKKSETNRSLGLSYGLSIANVVQTTVSIQGLEKMPLIIRGGFAVSTNEIAKAGYNDNLLIETGFAIRDSIVNPAVGIQYTLPQGLSFRFGQSTKFSVGAGWDLGEMKINYAYIPMTKHSVIDFAYSFGPGTIGQKKKTTQIKKRKGRKYVTAPETNDLRKVRNRALRVYDRYIRNAAEMMRHDLYAEARILLLKAIPLTRENKDAYKQITICEKVIQTKELSNLLMTANDILVKNPKAALSNYLSAYVINQDEGVFSVIIELIKKNPELRKKRTMFINNNITKFDLYLRSYDFEKAAGSINLLKNFVDRKKVEELRERIETGKNIYITRLIMKASEHFDMGEYSLSWKYFSAVYKLNNETAIKEKLNEIKGKYPVKKQDKIYTQKIYLLSAYNFATDESYVIDIKELFKYDMSFNVDDLKFSIKELKRTMPNELKINLN